MTPTKNEDNGTREVAVAERVQGTNLIYMGNALSQKSSGGE
ncbi:hypothetical protein [Bdellovibrio bacteriovorus]|nr:hypothetical protein [Bdellovibrio bacteriovorus]